VEETYIAGDVEGLKVGAPVTLRGLPVGQVTQINFSWNLYHRAEPRYVVIEFQVRSDAWGTTERGKALLRTIQEQVKQGLRARVRSQGLVGATVLSLDTLNPAQYPPLAVPWQPRHVYIPSAPGQFTEILAGLDKTVGKIERLDLENLAASVQRDLAAAERLLNHLDQVDVDRIGTNVNGLVSDLRQVSYRVDAFIGATNASSPAQSLEALSKQTRDILEQSKAAIANLDRKLVAVDMSSVNQALENVRQATEQLDEILHRFRDYPAGMLFGRPPPPARSVERPRGK
jgi:ABC-type transporter Mla subunit MlaD